MAGVKRIETRGKNLAPGETAHDDQFPGLSVQCYEGTGRRKWRLRYRDAKGVQRRATLGDFEALSPAAARGKARQVIEDALTGKAATTKRCAEPTWNQVWQMVYKDHYKDGATPWSKECKGLWEMYLAKPFGIHRVSELEPPHVRDWMNSLSDKPIRANRALQVLKVTTRWAEENGIIPAGSDPARRARKYPEIHRERVATSEEVRKMAAVLEKEQEADPFGAALLWVLLLTGARPKSLLEARWDQLTYETIGGQEVGVLTFVGKTSRKTGKKEVVVLPPKALEIIRALPEEDERSKHRVHGDPRIFRRADIPARLWTQVREEAGCPDLRARDLRRTFASIGLNNGVDKGTIGHLLNHSNQQTTDIYARMALGSRVAGTLKVSAAVETLLEKRHDNVERGGEIEATEEGCPT